MTYPAVLELKINGKIVECVSELVAELNELCELIPEWNNYEKEKSLRRIGVLLGDLIELKPIAKREEM